MVLYNKDIASEIKLKMVKKSQKGFVKVKDITNLIASLVMEQIIQEHSLWPTKGLNA